MRSKGPLTKADKGFRHAWIMCCSVPERGVQVDYKGKYGSWHDWSPKDMLPKLYRDYDLPQVGKERPARRNGSESLAR